MKIPDDPARAIAKLLSKLDEEDKDTLSFLIQQRGMLADSVLTKIWGNSEDDVYNQIPCICSNYRRGELTGGWQCPKHGQQF